MKRLFCVILAALTALAYAAALAEYDFSGLTLEQLYEARVKLDEEIARQEAENGLHVYESGSYAVGRDIPAGDYLLMENDGAVFASVMLRENNSEDAGLLMSHLVNGQAVIHLEKDTWLTLSEALAYPLSQSPYRFEGEAGEGGYLVGAMLPAGDYEICPVDKAPLSSYSVYGGILGTGAQLTKFEVLRAAATVTLAEGEYLELSGCTIRRAE